MMLNTTLSNDFRQTFENFRRTVDQMFGNVADPATDRGTAGATFSPVIESAWTENVLHLRAIVPGVAQNDLKVSLNNNQLILEGERRRPEAWERNSWTQLTYGKFQAAITLPNGLDLEKVSCRLHDGVLDIDIPVSEARRPRQIQVEVGTAEEQKTINAAEATPAETTH